MDKYVNKDIICAKMMYCNFRSPNMTVSDFINNELPTADVQPVKRGRWVQIGKQSAKCTECGGVLKSNGIDAPGKAYIFNAVYLYCPFCGADMREPIKG